MAKTVLKDFEDSLGNLANLVLTIVANTRVLSDNATGKVISSQNLSIALLEHTIGKLYGLRIDSYSTTLSFHIFGNLTSDSRFLTQNSITPLTTIGKWRNNLAWHINKDSFKYVNPSWGVAYTLLAGDLEKIVTETADLFIEMCKHFGDAKTEAEFRHQLNMLHATISIRVSESWDGPDGITRVR